MSKPRRKGPRKALRLEIRISERALNRIRGLAGIYAGGNVSAWLEHGGLNAPRKFLFKKGSR